MDMHTEGHKSTETTKKDNILFLIILGLTTLLFLYLMKPFFFPIFWAAVIAGIFQPLYRRLNSRMNRPILSTMVVFLVIALIILLPAGVVGTLVFNESVRLYAKLSPGTENLDKNFGHIVDSVTDHPYAHLLRIDKGAMIAKMTEVARSVTNYLFVNLTALTQNTFGFLIQFAIMLYTLFFFVRDGDQFFKIAMRIFPFGMGREKHLYERFIVTARSTLKVTLIIGGIQGALGGTIFFITGVDGALIWGLLMIIMAVVPVVGCSIIWAPGGLLMLMTGHIWEGIVILAFGFLIITMIDNLLRPILLGKDVEMHPLLIFLSTLGGIFVFGFSGFVIGPIITSLLLAIWQIYEERFL
jgi:predicted PurR-regulated permease PerM